MAVLPHPELQLLEAGVRAGVKAHDGGARGAVVHAAQRLELLGARRVPHPERDCLVAIHMHLDTEQRGYYIDSGSGASS